MLKLILILLQILLANNAVLTASIANSENGKKTEIFVKLSYYLFCNGK